MHAHRRLRRRAHPGARRSASSPRSRRPRSSTRRRSSLRTGWPRRRSPSRSPRTGPGCGPTSIDPKGVQAREAKPADAPVQGAPGDRRSAGGRSPGTTSRSSTSNGKRLGERQVGADHHARAQQSRAGYFQEPELTAAAWKTGFDGRAGSTRATSATWRTASLYICGRIKDIIIIRGRNFYPQDIEWVVSELPGVRRGNVVAFGVDVEGEEQLVVCAEAFQSDAAGLTRPITQAQSRPELGLSVHKVEIVPQGSAPADVERQAAAAEDEADVPRRHASATSRRRCGGTRWCSQAARGSEHRASTGSATESHYAGASQATRAALLAFQRRAVIKRAERVEEGKRDGVDASRGRGLVRRLERVLPALARRADELHVRDLRTERDWHTNSLEEAQVRKLAWHHEVRAPHAPRSACSTSAAAGARTSSTRRSIAGVKEVHGITLSRAQHDEIMRRKIPGVTASVCQLPRLQAGEEVRRRSSRSA